jgi:hypothetical protein
VIATGGSRGTVADLAASFSDRCHNVAANSRNATKSGAFNRSDKLALADDNIAEPSTAAKTVEGARREFRSINTLVFRFFREGSDERHSYERRLD